MISRLKSHFFDIINFFVRHIALNFESHFSTLQSATFKYAIMPKIAIAHNIIKASFTIMFVTILLVMVLFDLRIYLQLFFCFSSGLYYG